MQDEVDYEDVGADAFGEADFEGDGFDEEDGMYQEMAHGTAAAASSETPIPAADFEEQPWLDEEGFSDASDVEDVEDPEGYLEVNGEEGIDGML